MAYNPNNSNGQKTSANSAPVVVASDQSALQVSASALPLAPLASTSTLQTSGNASLTSIDSKTPSLVSGRQPVDGSGVTQPVSGSVSVLNFPGTQPVSGTVTANIGTSGSLALDTSVNTLLKPASTLAAVTSITNAVTIKADTAVNQANALKVDGSAVTQPISASALPLPLNASTSALQTTGNDSLSTIVTNTTGLVIAQGAATAGKPGQLQMGAVTTAFPTYQATQSSPLSLNTQGYLRAVRSIDEGKNFSTLASVAYTLSSATDSLLSLAGYKGGAAVGATTTPAVVTAGKTYRIESIQITQVAVAAAGTLRFTLRANSAGLVAIGSPAVQTLWVGIPASTAGVGNTVSINFPNGLEFAAGTGIGISLQGFNATGVAAAVGYGLVTITGYEY